MFIVITEPCGCRPFERGHKNPNCRIYQQQKQFEKKLQKILDNFKQALRKGISDG